MLPRRQRRRGIETSNPASPLVLLRLAAGRRWLIVRVGQILAQAVEQFIARQSALRRQRLDLVGAQRAGKIVRRDLLVGTVADPGICRVAVALLLQLIQEIAEAAADHAAGRTARKQSAQSTLEEVA